MTTRRREVPFLSRSLRFGLITAITAIAAAFTSVAWAQPLAEDAQSTLALVADAGPYVHEGAVLYAYHCAACHGDTGQGFAEARSVFPASHQTCTRCHRPANPPTMAPEAIRENNVFGIGEAPALLGDVSALDRFGSAAALKAYISATMPRPFPGTLSDIEYDQVVAFLMEAEGASETTVEADAEPPAAR